MTKGVIRLPHFSGGLSCANLGGPRVPVSICALDRLNRPKGITPLGKGVSVRDLILFDGIRTSCTMVILFEGDQEDHFHTLIPLMPSVIPFVVSVRFRKEPLPAAVHSILV